ncbi:MAG: radical SAM protein [Promethearchaeota archaeon]
MTTIPKIWLQQEKKVLLANFTDTLMVKDSEGKYSVINDFWRKKTYVKDDDKLLPMHEREFPEPYQVAQYYCGGTWNDFNSPFTIQIGFCNIRCFWCYVPENLKSGKNGKYFTAEEIVKTWISTEKKGILRLSGGEPFLAPNFIVEIGNEIEKLKDPNRYLWIDTNLLGFSYEEVVKKLSDLEIPFGITGCFKGFDEETFISNTNANIALFKKQFENAKKILDNLGGKGELFFYVPEILQKMNEKEIKIKILNFSELLSSTIHKNAPLRVTILSIKEYEVNKTQMNFDRLETGLTKKIWFEILKDKYPIELIWLPQYQINLKE